ncbi:MAG: hypothetical protein HY273_00595 [Gammaproteobacteria bacterium]|nr:hypothetical protein [Gammaproteobacteria bacterium]
MPASESKAAPSTAYNPDLDWSQVRETLRMLSLAVAQITNAMTDGDESVATLGNSFTTMANNAETISVAATQLPPSDSKTVIVEKCDAISAQMRQSIVAFQFYDKLTQRLAHVSGSLTALGDLVADKEQLYNPGAWRGMQEKIKSKYTIESERLMFEALIKGASVEEALAICKAAQAKLAQDKIELF